MMCNFDTQIIHSTKCFYSYGPKNITFNDQHHTFATIHNNAITADTNSMVLDDA